MARRRNSPRFFLAIIFSLTYNRAIKVTVHGRVQEESLPLVFDCSTVGKFVSEEAMKEIPLTQNQVAIVDDHWFEFLNQWKWHAYWDNHVQGYYAQRTERVGDGTRQVIRMHAVVAKTPKGMICDHIHHKTLDNREAELRNITQSQNTMNRRLRSDNDLGMTGIHKKKNSNSYVARLNIDGIRVLDKTVPTIEMAIKIRKEFVEKYFGEFAYQESI